MYALLTRSWSSCRLKDWYLTGLGLLINTRSNMSFRRAQVVDSAEPVRSYLRTLRDAGYFDRIAIPDDDKDLLEWASIQLAENVSRSMVGCTPTLESVAAGEFVLGTIQTPCSGQRTVSWPCSSHVRP